MSRFTVILLTMMAYMVTLSSHAQSSESERIKQLEAENQALRHELAELRLELSTLKKQLAAQDKPEDNQNTADNTDTPAQAEEGAGEVKVKTYRSADDICRAIPQGLGPGRNGWDVFKRKAVGDWLNESIPGSRYEARRIVKSTAVSFDNTTNQWMLTIHFEIEDMQYMSWQMKDKISSVRLFGEEKEVVRLEKRMQVGSRLMVTGQIDRFSFDPAGNKTDDDWRPSYCSITLIDVKVN